MHMASLLRMPSLGSTRSSASQLERVQSITRIKQHLHTPPSLCMHVHCISCLGCNRLNPTSITTHMTKFVLSSETRFYLENVVSVKDTSHIVLVIFQCTHHLQNKKDRLLQTSVIQLYLKHLPEENLRFSATWSFKRPHD